MLVMMMMISEVFFIVFTLFRDQKKKKKINCAHVQTFVLMWVHKEAKTRHQASSVSLCIFFLPWDRVSNLFFAGRVIICCFDMHQTTVYVLSYLALVYWLFGILLFSVPSIFFPVSLIKFYSSCNWNVHEIWLNTFHQKEIPAPTPNHRQPRLFRHRASPWLVSKVEQLCLWWCKLSLVCHTC